MPEITVSDLWVFPIKSARGTRLEESCYSETGLDFDRQWMIVDASTHGFLTARTIPRMILIHPTLDLPNQTLSISIPAHSTFPASTHTIPLSPPADAEYVKDLTIWGSDPLDGYIVGSPLLTKDLSEFMGKPVLLVQKGQVPRLAGMEEGWIDQWLHEIGESTQYPSSVISWPDQFPILLVSQRSIREIDEMVKNDETIRNLRGFDVERWTGEKGSEFEVERFRGNILVDGVEDAFEEESWGELELSSAKEQRTETMFVAARCARCILPNVDPTLGVRDKVVPDTVLRKRDTYGGRLTWDRFPDKVCFGMNVVPKAKHGTIRVGDVVSIIKKFDKDPDRSTFLRPEDSF